ncbi:hypothetical protein IFM89_004987 [Coptis chinensis]|uniref:DUF4283 domain-containing protein n=1 Tax=Coptis chinensis TaxID=261450 RepID=A0A835HT05_9MAGN|nr:hypothetical protein IFM89_004987 [Coptis chinensis]
MVDSQHMQGVNAVNPGAQTRNWNELFQGEKGASLETEHKLPYPVVREFLRKKWQTKGNYEMVADSNLFYFKFTNEEDKRKVLGMAQIFMAGKCFIVTQWNQDVEKRKNTVKAIPIWINLYNVPKDLWTGEGLGEVPAEVEEQSGCNINEEMDTGILERAVVSGNSVGSMAVREEVCQIEVVTGREVQAERKEMLDRNSDEEEGRRSSGRDGVSGSSAESIAVRELVIRSEVVAEPSAVEYSFVIVLGLVLVFNPTVLVLLFLAGVSFVVASFGGLTIGASGAELEIDNVGAELEIDKDGVELSFVEDAFPFGDMYYPYPYGITSLPPPLQDGGALSTGGALASFLLFLDLLGGSVVSANGGGALLLGGGGRVAGLLRFLDLLGGGVVSGGGGALLLGGGGALSGEVALSVGSGALSGYDGVVLLGSSASAFNFLPLRIPFLLC